MSTRNSQTGKLVPQQFARLTLAAAVFAASQASAMEFDTGNRDLSVRWDNTVKYSVGVRLKDRLPELSTEYTAQPNANDGNNNFDKGSLIQNRVDLLSEFDVAYRNKVGLRVSGAAWYDDVYRGRNDNDGTTFVNRFEGEPVDEFSPETRELMGKDAELLDAFVYGRFSVADRPVTVRAGSHTIIWGESLFFGANAIAGGQAPIDVIKVTSVPGTTTKEFLMPTGKVSLQAQLADNLSFAAYVPYEWEESRLPAVGSYLAAGDVVGPGTESILVAGQRATVIDNLDAKDSGQGGISFGTYLSALDADIGVHAIRYHATAPSGIFLSWENFPGGTPDTFQSVYHEGIEAYGISASKTVGNVNFGAEVSVRDNTPLASTAAEDISPATPRSYNNSSNPGYAVGRTAHANLNWISLLSPSALYNEAMFLGEIAWNRTLSVSEGERFLNPVADRDATSARFIFRPMYRQALDGLDLGVPIGVSYTSGRSSAIGPSFGAHDGGDVSLGLEGTYLNRWDLSLRYVYFYGEAGAPQNEARQMQYLQTKKDRDFLAFSVQTTF